MEKQAIADKNCLYHPEKKGVAFCKRCKGYICNDCIIEVDGKKRCEKCYHDYLEQMKQKKKESKVEKKSEKEIQLKSLVNLVNGSEISSIRSIVSNIVQIINDPKSTVKDLKKIIMIDPPLTAKVLRTANSAYYASRTKISEIDQAVIWIGFNAVRELALNQKVCEIFDRDQSISGYSRASLWKHSVAVALLGKMMYRREFGERGEDAYIAGLLHDIGIIAEDQFLQDDFEHILNQSATKEKNLYDIEEEFLGYNHAEVGKAVINNWNLPDELSMAVGYHHYPEKAPKKYAKIVMSLYVAESFCQNNGFGYSDAPCQNEFLFERCLNELKVKPYALELIAKDMKVELEKMEAQGVF